MADEGVVSLNPDERKAIHPFTMRVWRWFWRARARVSPPKIEIGASLPDFYLGDLHGQHHRLSKSFPQKGVVLWMTNLCTECEKKVPLLNQMSRLYREKVDIFAVSVLGEDVDTPRGVAERQQPVFPMLLDPQDWVGHGLGFEHPGGACPMFNLLVLNREGKIVFRTHLSAVKEEKLEEVIKSI